MSDHLRGRRAAILAHPIAYNGAVANGMSTDIDARATDTLDGTGLIVWFTGLSGAGKTTISEAVRTELLARHLRVEVLDGDAVRKDLSKDLGFTRAGRDENIRRIGYLGQAGGLPLAEHVAGLLARNGVIVLVSAISPYRAGREEIRQRFGRFVEVFVNAPLDVCVERDPKGLYKKARAGLLMNLTGVDDPYEPPISPEVECCTDRESVEDSVTKVLSAVLPLT